MILEVVQSKWSLTWYDPLGSRMCVLELMNGHVLQTLREKLKVPGSRPKRAGYENKEGKNEDPKLALRTEQTRLIRCLLYGFVDYSGFEMVIES